jgi:predicted RNase H-like nuclease (RuvC/YqgF family)
MEADDEAVLMYGDLEESAKESEFNEMKRQYKEIMNRNKYLENELVELRKQVETMNKERQNVETNFVELYNTAAKEIERKDRAIKDFNDQLMNHNSIVKGSK